MNTVYCSVPFEYIHAFFITFFPSGYVVSHRSDIIIRYATINHKPIQYPNHKTISKPKKKKKYSEYRNAECRMLCIMHVHRKISLNGNKIAKCMLCLLIQCDAISFIWFYFWFGPLRLSRCMVFAVQLATKTKRYKWNQMKCEQNNVLQSNHRLSQVNVLNVWCICCLGDFLLFHYYAIELFKVKCAHLRVSHTRKNK